LSRDARILLDECVAEFVGFLTGEVVASESAVPATASDYVAALRKLGFEQYANVLEEYLKTYEREKATRDTKSEE
jgi:hypothetical protein